MPTLPFRIVYPVPFGVRVIFPFVSVLEIMLPFRFRLSTCRAVRVPREVIAVCAAPVTVAAVPVVFWLRVGNVFVPDVKFLLVRVCAVERSAVTEVLIAIEVPVIVIPFPWTTEPGPAD
jgi:hypothetical protein